MVIPNKPNEPKIVEEQEIPIRLFEGKKFIGTCTVKLVTYSDGKAKLFDEDGELKAIGEPKNEKRKGHKKSGEATKYPERN